MISSVAARVIIAMMAVAVGAPYCWASQPIIVNPRGAAPHVVVRTAATRPRMESLITICARAVVATRHSWNP